MRSTLRFALAVLVLALGPAGIAAAATPPAPGQELERALQFGVTTEMDMWSVPVSLHRDLELLVPAGLTPADALAAATANPAAAFGLADRGRIAPGLRADLLLVQGDPTVDIKATARSSGSGRPKPASRPPRLQGAGPGSSGRPSSRLRALSSLNATVQVWIGPRKLEWLRSSLNRRAPGFRPRVRA